MNVGCSVNPQALANGLLNFRNSARILGECKDVFPDLQKSRESSWDDTETYNKNITMAPNILPGICEKDLAGA